MQYILLYVQAIHLIFFLFQNIFMAASFPTFSKECLEEPFVYMMLMECDHDTHDTHSASQAEDMLRAHSPRKRSSGYSHEDE